MRRRRPKTLKAIWPSAAVEADYRRRLDKLIREMSASYRHFLKAQYRENPPAMAEDSPATDLRIELRRLNTRWRRRFDEAAPLLARWFLKSVNNRSERALMKILRDAGIAIPFRITPEMRDIMDATVAENVALIRSIPQHYHTEVEVMVMQSVKAGRDLSQLSDNLEARYDITRRRAELIARDQNNKATASLNQARQVALGIEEGVWLHSHAGKEPRPTHVANNGKKFDIKKGWFDPDKRVRRHILPGELINCRCTWKAVVPGFS